MVHNPLCLSIERAASQKTKHSQSTIPSTMPHKCIHLRPPTKQLSELKFPWQYPTRIQSEVNLAKWMEMECNICKMVVQSEYSRSIKWSAICCNSNRACLSCPLVFSTRRLNNSMWPTRMKEDATRQVIAHCSVIIRVGLLACMMIC